MLGVHLIAEIGELLCWVSLVTFATMQGPIHDTYRVTHKIVPYESTQNTMSC